MKDTLKKTSLVMLMLGSLGLAIPGTHAAWGRGGNDYGPRPGDALRLQSEAFQQRIDARQTWQRDRIRAGMADGSLTRREFRYLMEEQREIGAMERRFRADGIIDAREFRHLDHALDRASHSIRMERHDRQAWVANNDGPWRN